METKATITAIGAAALAPNDPLVILFDDSATPALREVTLIQQFEDLEAQRAMTLATGDTLVIGATPFTITAVGQLANPSLQSIGHVALVFTAPPAEDRLENALYLKPTTRPHFEVGTTLTYQTNA
ncbi:PTS glucitol/sorbitol transporter subunit IIA [Lacticaseibacillus daqingensis]|uniref:PTS glucitol/sorbitol transporter subunit IIA n=1 Tax=Lacticaseibacillus daqingensis TaxID=2486014 RepID=UPI000F76EFAF|nr:PTS glucitol/sorbitol transporter subunit IIA [Lacticaseibacillus daqingensis]